MDDEGTGGSSRSHDRNPERRLMRESSLPPTLRPHLYHAPRHISSQGFAPLIVPDWPNQPTRSRSQDYGRSLPSPSHLLNQIQTQDHRTAIEQGHQDHRIVLDQGHQDHRIVLDQGHIEEPQRDLRPQVDSFPSQSIRGAPAVKRESGTPTEEGGSTSASTGPTTSTRRKPSTKVEVACQFCRGRKLRCDGKKPCSNCSGRGTECTYQTGGPRRRGPGKAPKKTRAESSRQRQRQQQQQQQQQFPPDQSQMSISAGSPGPSGPSPITIVPTTGIILGGRPLTPGGIVMTGPRFPSQSPGASTSGMETGSQSGSRRRPSGSSVEEPERKRSRIREFEGERRP